MTNKHTLKQCRRYTYSDCLRDAVPTPSGTNGRTLYQVLMVGGTVVLVVTADGALSSGSDFFVHSR